MQQWLLEYEKEIRLSFFLGIFAAVGLAEYLLPRRKRLYTRLRRWSANLGLVLVNNLVLRLLFPVAAAGAALWAADHGWGLFNIVDLPLWFEFIATLLILDLVIWIQHVMVHAIPILWRLHRVHHADPDFDVTTGARFHPLEIILSMLIKFAVLLLLGPAVAAVIVFEIMINATSMFNHGNLKLPQGVDRILRLFIVTPDMHRVHHSMEEDETNSNFGFNLPWWDRMFGTYRAQPRAGHEAMQIGTHDCPDLDRDTNILGMLMIPFRGKIDGYTINRRSWHDPEKQSSEHQ